MSNRNETVFTTFPVLETERLALREMVEDDAEDLFGYYHDENVTQYLDWAGPSSVEHAKQVIANWNKGFAEKKFIRWGIALKSDNRLIGTCECGAMYADLADHGEHPCPPNWIAYELSKSHWGNGIMTEVLQRVIPYIFDTLETHRIEATVSPENIASFKLLKKFGFFVEGYMREQLYHLGTKQFYDKMLLSLLKREFKNHL